MPDSLVFDEWVISLILIIFFLILLALIVYFVFTASVSRASARFLTLCCLFLIWLLIVIVIVVVPSLFRTWIILCENEDEVFSSQFDTFLGISDHISDFFFLLLALTSSSLFCISNPGIDIIFLKLIVVDHLPSVKTYWNHESSRRKVIEEIGVFATAELRRHLYMIEVRCRDLREILLPNRLSWTGLRLLSISND